MSWQPIQEAPFSDLLLERDRPKPCLVYGKDCGVQMGRAWRYPDGEATGQAFGFCGDWEITHWMPLPEPPK